MSFTLALALLTSSEGIYDCSTSERIEPGTWAVFRSRYDNGVEQLPSFHIRYMGEADGAISQQMEWYDVPRWNEHLGAPDSIGFSIPTPRPDRKGFLKFSANGQSWAAPQEPGFIHALSGSGISWVEFQGYRERNQFWKGGGWKVEAVDRRGRVIGTALIRMPDPTRVEEVYDRLRADLIRLESDRAKNCEYYPPPEPGEEDPGAIVGITVSGSSGQA